MWVNAFLQEFKSACYVRGIHEGAAMRLFKQYSTGPAEAAVKARDMLASSATFYHEGALKSNSAIVQYLLKRYVMADSIAELDAEVCYLRQVSVIPAEHTQKLRMKTQSCGSV